MTTIHIDNELSPLMTLKKTTSSNDFRDLERTMT
jgi:hypothetical protein